MIERRNFLRGFAILLGSVGLGGLALPITAGASESSVPIEIINRFKFHNFLRAQSGFERISLNKFIILYGRYL